MKLYFYEDRAGLWRWRLKSRNGRVTHASTESFKRLAMCVKNFNLLKSNAEYKAYINNVLWCEATLVKVELKPKMDIISAA